MASTERGRCVYCGAPTKRGPACPAHADVAKADQELTGNASRAQWRLARSAESEHDDGPLDPRKGAP